jgi:hypothetical protein
MRITSRHLAPALFGAALAVFVSRPAKACSCAEPSVVQLNLPQGEGVSIHTAIFVGQYAFIETEPTSLWLANAAGPIAAKQTRFKVGNEGFIDLDMLKPSAALAPQTQYFVYRCRGEGPTSTFEESCDALSSFTTGPATEPAPPPALPRLVGKKAVADPFGSSSSCGDDIAYVSYTLEWEGAVLLTELDELNVFSFENPQTPIFADAKNPYLQSIAIGRSACGGWWSSSNKGDRTEVHFGVISSEGQFSGWTEPQKVKLPDPGCSIGSRSSGWSSAFAAGFLLLAGMQRRSRAPAGRD